MLARPQQYGVLIILANAPDVRLGVRREGNIWLWVGHANVLCAEHVLNCIPTLDPSNVLHIRLSAVTRRSTKRPCRTPLKRVTLYGHIPTFIPTTPHDDHAANRYFRYSRYHRHVCTRSLCTRRFGVGSPHP